MTLEIELFADLRDQNFIFVYEPALPSPFLRPSKKVKRPSAKAFQSCEKVVSLVMV